MKYKKVLDVHIVKDFLLYAGTHEPYIIMKKNSPNTVLFLIGESGKFADDKAIFAKIPLSSM